MKQSEGKIETANDSSVNEAQLSQDEIPDTPINRQSADQKLIEILPDELDITMRQFKPLVFTNRIGITRDLHKFRYRMKWPVACPGLKSPIEKNKWFADALCIITDAQQTLLVVIQDRNYIEGQQIYEGNAAGNESWKHPYTDKSILLAHTNKAIILYNSSCYNSSRQCHLLTTSILRMDTLATNKDQCSHKVVGILLSIEDLASVVVEEEKEDSQTCNSKVPYCNKLEKQIHPKRNLPHQFMNMKRKFKMIR
ncbi:MAG: hypothetical protein EZS28_014022 [Streblomastix strix]|uniref:Uncharacterized protein n=1 Tax=Streblomastix strix TaxID=222440 RepID=A0A5J4W675_9EUKA|nr:MAG: hypothetical protein EZS28_014022 [Streblomastix strix]